jgi:hypothetical protein
LNSNVDQNLINSLNDLRNKKIRLEGKLEIALIKKQLNTLLIENKRIENQLNTLQNENSGKKYKIKLFG